MESELLDHSLESASRVAFISSMTDIIYSNMQHKKKFIHKVCKEPVLTVSIVIYFSKNFYLVGAINRKLSSLLASGIISHIIGKYVDLRFYNVKTEIKGREMLSMKHLQGVFELWIILCLISSSIFLLELCIDASKRSLKFQYFRRRLGM